jgi:hypothetical protein
MAMARVLFPGAVGGRVFRGYYPERWGDGCAAHGPYGGADKSLAGNNFMGSVKNRRASAPIKRLFSVRYWVRRIQQRI